jgi:release factor glutamine methyltransferase
MTISQLLRTETQRLESVFDSGEARASARAIFEDVAGYSQKFIFMNGDREMLEETAERLTRTVDAVLAGTPVQYATGHARFYGLDFAVTPAVLIPRPETEGLVDLVVDDCNGRSDLRVLDIATGSGCIACALARALAFPQVTALDISEDALTVAQSNAKALNVKVDFIHDDILTATAPTEAYDVIVSNPPYIARSEAAAMDERVLDHEPDLALFVSDDDPLIFYRTIGIYSVKALRPGGKLYFEINPRFAEELAAMLRKQSYDNVTILRDYIGRQRFISATKAR